MPMSFPPEHYLEASLERHRDAARLHDGGSYTAAIYVSGLAVECMLRAYRRRLDDTLESRHDLQSLMRASGVLEFVKEREQRDFAVALGTVWQFWKNNYRFAEASRLRARYRELELTKGIRGEPLKWASSEVYDAATIVIVKGKQRWSS